MCHERAGSKEEVQNEVAIAYTIEAVLRHSVEAEVFCSEFSDQGKEGTHAGAGSQGRCIGASAGIFEAVAVSKQHLSPRKKVVPKSRWHSALQVSVCRKWVAGVLFGQHSNATKQDVDLFIQLV